MDKEKRECSEINAVVENKLQCNGLLFGDLNGLLMGRSTMSAYLGSLEQVIKYGINEYFLSDHFRIWIQSFLFIIN